MTHTASPSPVLFICVIVGSLALSPVSLQQARADTTPEQLTLRGAVRFALDHSPALRTSQASEALAAGQVEVGRTLQLPQLGVSAEVLRATGNVVSGSLFPAVGIPASAGPPKSPAPFDSGAWGSALGIWGDWAFSDLARRMRLVDAALAETGQAQAATAARRLDVAFQAVDAFLAVATARESVRALQANVERAQTLMTSVRALADQQLRPTSDVALAAAELARASTLMVQARQTEGVARARLAEALGVAGQPVDIAPDALAENAPAMPAAPPALDQHPQHQQAQSAIRSAELRRRAQRLEYLPRFDLVAALWLRGSGYFKGTTNLGSAQGLLPDTANWGVGIVAVWPVLDLFVARARAHVASAGVALERARRDELVQALVGQLDAARATLDGAARVLQYTAPALEAARAAERQAAARYQAGLATLIEVADAQRMLADADLADAMARASVWRSRALFARATGDLSPFLLGSAPESTNGGR